MDARAHLLSLGWAGPGHSLDSRPNEPGSYKQKGHRGLAYDPSKDPLKVGNTGNGLIKPLLVSQRKNRFGIGKKAYEAPAGNEWWLKGFESALGNIGKSESERSSGTSTPVNVPAGKHGGLYAYFTAGQIMKGTIEEDVAERSSRKRKSDEFEEDNHEKLNPRPTSPKKPATAHEFEMVSAFMRERDKQEKKRKKEGKASELEQFSLIGQFFDVAEKQQKQNRKRKSAVLNDETVASTPEVVNCGRPETKEERRERRRKRKEEKAMKAATNGVDGGSESEDAATKAARRAERKRRKADKAARAKS